jgi:hypothetical protein
MYQDSILYASDSQTGVRGPREGEELQYPREEHMKYSKGAAERSHFFFFKGQRSKKFRTAPLRRAIY